jgi:hypothetical protein
LILGLDSNVIVQALRDQPLSFVEDNRAEHEISVHEFLLDVNLQDRGQPMQASKGSS